ncbi:hypothetical protein BDZ91DRAFT_751746 [Kalaharituber pfeilii]|nr:hypothetical protein BDZ91DRAFT_751746 [Kalaharituber pfeilii]
MTGIWCTPVKSLSVTFPAKAGLEKATPEVNTNFYQVVTYTKMAEEYESKLQKVDDIGFPLTIAIVREIALKLFQIRKNKLIERYLKHYLDTLDCQRAAANNPVVLKKFIQVIECIMKRHKIPVQNIWNMDEKEFLLG